MNSNESPRYLFVTAALGSLEMLSAANRLVESIKNMKVFDEFVIVTESTLMEIAPWLVEVVPAEDWNLDHKFGYYIWKPIIAQQALNEVWGKFDGVCYLDAGCEVIPTYWNRKAFLNYLQKARKLGGVVFSTLAEERSFTKARVFDVFPEIESKCITPQIAGGSWFLSGQLGRRVVEAWAYIATSDYENINDTVQEGRESPEFIAPRHDQSIFSLACKSHGIFAEDLVPPGGSSFKSQVRALFFPFRWARNRSGINLTASILRFIGELSLNFYFFLVAPLKALRIKPFAKNS